MNIEKSLQKAILADARDIAKTKQLVNVRTLCEMHFGTNSGSVRQAVSKLLDEAAIPRRQSAKPIEAATSPSDFGAKYEALSRVFVEVSKPAPDIDLYLVERAKAGNVRALEILKKLVG